MMADQILFVSCSTSIRQMPPMSFGQMAAKINADMSMGSTRYWMIDGHTCTSICDNGTSNDWLSWHRAAAIKSKLIAAGVPANHLKIRGFASNWIVVNPSTHPDNRRVEIYAADDAGYPLSLEQSDNMMMCPKPSDCPF
ncbi:MAG: hypothetical protein KDA78_03280 [Planctomycetaceae bacterium]|nr:hypothetical protein [Planctomycetaceae bacterium]